MTIRNLLGNALIAMSSAVGASTSVVVANAASYHALHKPHILLGFTVPNWVGIVIYLVFLCIGILMAINQPTPIDHKFKYPWLKPIYSFSFGVIITVFGLPEFYPNITIWQMIIPVLFFASIGAAVIYYVIDFCTSDELWLMIKKEAYGGVKEMMRMGVEYIKNILKAIVGRSDK